MMEKERIHEGGIRRITREGIVEAAGNLFLKNGIKKVTMDDVAYSLSMSKRTLYELFSSKESLLFEFVNTSYKKKMAEIMKLVEQKENVLEVILTVLQLRSQASRKVGTQFVKDIKGYKSLLAMFNEHRNEMEQKEMEFFKTGIQQGFFLADIDYALQNQLLHMQLESISNLFEEPYKVVEAQNETIYIYLRGISTTEGQKVIENFRNNKLNNNN